MSIEKLNARAWAGLLLLATAGWLAWPDRNLHGNASMEEALTSCRTEDGRIFRLYRGNGGATVAHWYTVTAEGGLFEGENLHWPLPSRLRRLFSCFEAGAPGSWQGHHCA